MIGLAERAGRRWVHLDVGAFNGFMEALESGNALRFPVTDSRGSGVRAPAHLTGPTCDSQDTIMFDVPLSVDLAVVSAHLDPSHPGATSISSMRYSGATSTTPETCGLRASRAISAPLVLYGEMTRVAPARSGPTRASSSLSLIHI